MKPIYEVEASQPPKFPTFTQLNSECSESPGLPVPFAVTDQEIYRVGAYLAENCCSKPKDGEWCDIDGGGWAQLVMGVPP